jgi:tight adherence protein B
VSRDLLFVFLALVFLGVSGLVLWLMDVWGRRWSTRGRSLRRRLSVIAEQRRYTRRVLVKDASAHLPPWLASWLTQVPGMVWVRALLRRSGTGRSLVSVLVWCLGLGMAFGLLVWVLTPVPGWLAVGLGLAAFAAPVVWLQRLANRRRARFEAQLPEALDFMTRALRSGFGLTVALGMVGDELPAPIGVEFKHGFDQISIGMSFDDAMADMAERLQSSDLNFLVIALVIHRQTGGNLTELLTSLARTVRERIKLKGKVRVLASEGRLSGLLIGALPFLLAAILSAVNPGYMSSLWLTPAGQTLVGVGLSLMAVGGLWMWQIVQIRV